MQKVKELCEHLLEMYQPDDEVKKFYIKVKEKISTGITHNPKWPKEEK